MKYNPDDNEYVGDRRSGRPPLPADTKHREQEQRRELPVDLDDDETIGNTGNNETTANVERAHPFQGSNVGVDEYPADDEDAYHPTPPQKRPHRDR